jgi:VanZ family protein
LLAPGAYHRILRRVLILIVLLIVYGSLYPWHFTVPHLLANPLWILVHSWHALAPRYFLRDIVVNVALYIPLGFAAHLVFRQSRVPGLGIYGPILLGLSLSTAVELAQLLEPARDTSSLDVITNVAGSFSGVLLGLLFEAIASRRPGGKFRMAIEWKIADRAALALAFCWVAWLIFPLFPALSIYSLMRRLAVFAHSSPFDPLMLVSTAAAWYAGGLLVSATGPRISRRWFLAALLAIPGQFFIADRQPVQSELIGATCGALLFALPQRTREPSRTDAWAFLAVIVVRGLSPFHFATRDVSFEWIPFGATLGSEWQSAAAVLIEKIFYYGTAIWLLRAAGLKRALATIAVAAILAAIEILQTHLPGRTPEITDPILALVLGFVLSTLAGPGAAGVSECHRIRGRTY